MSRPYRGAAPTIPRPNPLAASQDDDPAPFTHTPRRPVAESEPQSAANLIAEHGAGRTRDPRRVHGIRSTTR